MKNLTNNIWSTDEYPTEAEFFINKVFGNIDAKCFINICFKNEHVGGFPARSYPINNLDVVVKDILSNTAGSDVYFELCPQRNPAPKGKRGKSSGVGVVPMLWLDLDIAGDNHKAADYPATLEEALTFLYSLPWKPTFINCSGGGLHVYYLFRKSLIIESDETRELVKELSKKIQSFIKVKGNEKGWNLDGTADLARVLRVPGTLNQKPLRNGNPPQEVYIIEHDPTALYKIEDFRVVLDTELIQVEEIESEAQGVLPTKSSSNLPVANDFPEADIELIESHCNWLAHCKYDADTLSEPEWFGACSVWCRCNNGRAVTHERSKSYPGYDPAETDRKVDNALKAAPRTCASILVDFSAAVYCNSCFLKDRGKSPISLGNPDPITQANIKISKMVLNSKFNPRVAFEDDNLAALALLKYKSPGDFTNAKNVLKKAGIAKGDLIPVLDRFIATHDISFEETANYEVASNCIYANKATAQGMTLVKLSAFSATISEQIIKDDGATSERYYRVEGVKDTGEKFPSVLLPVPEFEAMGWIGKAWGAGAWFAAGAGVRDNLRAAITYLSKDIPEKYTFAHSGWSKASGQWTFLSEAGAIGIDGIIDSLTVDLSTSNLSDFSIPEPSDGFVITGAIKKCLLLLELLPKYIAYPLLSAAFRAPLGESLPINFALFLVGATGSYKSEIASVVQGFFGQNFAGTNLPANWSSSANAIERIAFQSKDVLLVVDDFLPGDNPRLMNSKADRVFRALGNRAGRQRMNADTSLKKEYYPRSLIVATAEDVPSGQSLTGRMLVLEIDKSEVNLDVLTELQRLSSQGVLNAVLFYYIKWIAAQIEPLKENLSKYKTDLRLKALEAEKTHSRTPDIVADLTIGFESFCYFALAQGAMTEEESETLKNQCWNSLLVAAANQRSQQQDSDPCKRFGDLLNASFLLGLAHLESTTGGVPLLDPEKWGWKSYQGQMDERGIAQSSPTRQGSQIGWVDLSFVYLESEAAFNIAQRVGARDRPITTSLKTLRLRLAERKHLVPDPVTGHNTTRMHSIGGKRPRVMKIHKIFFDDDGTVPAEPVSCLDTGGTFQPREQDSVAVTHIGTPVINDEMQQPTQEENLFEAFNNTFGKK